MKKKTKPRNLKEALKGKLTAKEMKFLKTSFDTLGNLAIIEIPPELLKKERVIGNALLQVHSNITTVCKKAGARAGLYRIQKLKVIAGHRTKIADYRESGSRFKIPADKVFFSPRLSTERLRISKLIKNDETVGVFFAGVGPFAIVFAKQSKAKLIYGIELNPIASTYFEKNVILNKVTNKVIPLEGDVKKVVPKQLKGKCDRVVMPLPKDAESFLGEAFLALKPKGGTIHFYNFSDSNEPFREPVQKLKAAAKVHRKKARVKFKRKTRSYAPDIVQVVIDVKIAPS